MTSPEQKSSVGRPYPGLARPEHLQTDGEIDAFMAATFGLTVEELRRNWYDPNAPELSDEEIDRLID